MDILRFLIGILAIAIGYSLLWLFCCINKINEKAKQTDTSISITALRVSFWVALSGIIIIILGLLYLMEVLPAWI